MCPSCRKYCQMSFLEKLSISCNNGVILMKPTVSDLLGFFYCLTHLEKMMRLVRLTQESGGLGIDDIYGKLWWIFENGIGLVGANLHSKMDEGMRSRTQTTLSMQERIGENSQGTKVWKEVGLEARCSRQPL
eukprot:TRINITY_DN26843_c0_g1_i1.p1 TRINITY_DN26843_c0_g1~~TRINITY_DN26843_c0_g1_i1.p1  ORF type:complete len:132 (-),score=14.82 TRINITY_DN26843_c0_g1_i1:293-688(-)